MPDPQTVTNPAAPPSPAAPALDRPDVAEAQARIAAIRGDPTHAFHRGDRAAVDQMARDYTIVHGTAPVGTGARLAADPASALQGPLDAQSRQAFDETFQQAGVPGDVGQAVVDVFLGVRDELPEAAIGAARMTEAQGVRALEDEVGPEEARQILAKGRRVVDVLKSLSPDVKDRIEYALNASGAGNLPGVLRQFAAYHDLEPEAARRLVERTFGLKHAEKLFGPVTRRGGHA